MPRLLITVIFAVALVKGVAFATKERSSRSNCNVEMATHCCQNMTSSNDPRAMQMLEYFGLPIPKEVVLVGRNCTQANETATCQAAPVCCQGNTWREITFDCSPANQHGGGIPHWVWP